MWAIKSENAKETFQKQSIALKLMTIINQGNYLGIHDKFIKGNYIIINTSEYMLAQRNKMS